MRKFTFFMSLIADFATATAQEVTVTSLDQLSNDKTYFIESARCFLMNNTVANAQMLLVFRFIEQEVINARELNKNGKNLHTMIVCDEAHLFIDAKFPIALDFFFSMLF